MAAITEGAGPRLLRPLLAEPPAALRRFCAERGVAWVEDPSNASPTARRSRLRLRQGDPDGDGPGTRALVAAASDAGHRRTAQDRRIADILAERVTIRPEGFALLTPGVIDPDALAAVLRTIAGASYPPSPGPVADLARALRPTTLAGARVLDAGRLGPGWLLIREERSIAPAIPATKGAVWDGRFRVLDDVPHCTIGALGNDAVRLRRHSPLPSAVLRTLPALRYGNVLAAVPHLLYRAPAFGLEPRVLFHPPVPLAGAPFAPI
jgi:tRNA(Ile)-lysidine synthase